jgi:hypothetical protein
MILCDTTHLYFPDERNASGRFFPPMKRFDVYKTSFKPYVKLLNFLHKNTYEVFNRNIGFYLHKNILFYFLYKRNNCNNCLVLQYVSNCVCHLQVILLGNAVFGCLLYVHDTVGD